jgi:uncharacterized protein (TIGR02996 family)
MDLEQAFLADMVAHPHDATPWLVFADWLDEREDPRGELVRLLRLCWDEPGKKAFRERHARLQELFASGVRLPVPRFTNSLGMELVWVPPGHFWSGNTTQRPKVEMAEPFWMGVYLVTQGEWQAVMGDNPSYFRRDGTGAYKLEDVSDEDLARFPVECISYDEVQSFLERLNAREPRSGWTYRLPTSEEWEFAVRSPVTCQKDCAYWFYFDTPTNSISSVRANVIGDQPYKAPKGPNVGRTTKVGSYPPSRLGLYDHHGNVWEWTETVQGQLHVRRGGSWCGNSTGCAAGTYLNSNPSDRAYYLGFRLARVATRE